MSDCNPMIAHNVTATIANVIDVAMLLQFIHDMEHRYPNQGISVNPNGFALVLGCATEALLDAKQQLEQDACHPPNTAKKEEEGSDLMDRLDRHPSKP